MQLAIFDLDHTLLSGDSDQLWCNFLIGCGRLPMHSSEAAAEVALRYTAGTIAPLEYCQFFASMISGSTLGELESLRRRFLDEVVRDRIPEDARALLRRHREAGDILVLTTATNRIVSELTAKELQMDHYLCTELEVVEDRITGRIVVDPNMGTGKLKRLRAWLPSAGYSEELLKQASFYSDSINDLSLLSVVGRPIVVDPDVRLEGTAWRKRWAVLRLHRER